MVDEGKLVGIEVPTRSVRNAQSALHGPGASRHFCSVSWKMEL